MARVNCRSNSYHIFYRLIEQCEYILQRRCSLWDRASVLSAGPPKPEKLLYSTLHLQTDSSFTGLACCKWDWVSLFLGPGGLGVGHRATLPGENSITVGVKYTQQQACCMGVSVVNFWRLESKFPERDIHYKHNYVWLRKSLVFKLQLFLHHILILSDKQKTDFLFVFTLPHCTRYIKNWSIFHYSYLYIYYYNQCYYYKFYCYFYNCQTGCKALNKQRHCDLCLWNNT